MTAILTSSLGDSYVVDGRRVPKRLYEENGLLMRLKSLWKDNSKVLIISAFPENYDMNDGVLACIKKSFSLSGLSVSLIEICDYRNREIAEKIGEFDVVLLSGGHVPTQNAFMREIDLKSRLKDFKGLLMALSAGSMNSAKVVYAQPELEGEAADENYHRFIEGLGITERMIIPHFQDIKDVVLDGMRVIEDIAYPDSMGREFIALNDGSYIFSEGGKETLYGEAYIIKDGKQRQICLTDQSVLLE